MTRYTYRLPFKLLGIPIQLDITFLFILPILAWLIANNIHNYVDLFGLQVEPEALTDGLMPFALGLIAAVGLFVSVVIHELGHCVVGQRFGFEINSITLWLLGGMAQFEKLPRRPGAEAVMAIAGPVTSFGLAGVCAVLLSLTPAEMPSVIFVLSYLAWMNVILATFNLLPALPLDGGRVLRSLLALKMSHLQATLIATNTSKAMAFGLGLLGLFTMNFFLILIAFFVYVAVTAESQMTTATEALRGIKVRDLMTTNVSTVDPDVSVGDLLRKMLDEKHAAYPVVNGSGDVIGLVSLNDLGRAASDHIASQASRVREVMQRQFTTVVAEDTAVDAFRLLGQDPTGRLIVLDSNKGLQGIISKTDLVRAVRVRLTGEQLETPTHHVLESETR